MILDRNSFGIWSFIAKRAFKAEFIKPKMSDAIDSLRRTLKETEVAMYIHIPFCTGTCMFCPYVRRPVPKQKLEEIVGKYVRALIKELEMYHNILKDHELKIVDIHAGGGTPSLITGKYWKILLESISELFNTEPKIAIEANPEDLRDEAKTFDLIDSGVNEVSLGVQSFNPKMLKILGRRHSVNDSLVAIENLRNAGCKYINIDLMYMIPTQTIKDWVLDLEKASQQEVDEITCYPTLITPYTIGYKLIREGKIPPQPDSETFKEMIYACENILPSKGFKGVEIYGYSRSQWKYITVNYEMEGPLISVGCGATGFTGGFEYQNTCFIEEYFNSILQNKLPIAGARNVTEKERAIRYTVTRLFICRALSKREFKLKFKKEFDEYVGNTVFGKFLKILKITRDIEESVEEITLTRKGLLMAHKVCWAFVLNVPCRMAEEYSKTPWPLKVVIP